MNINVLEDMIIHHVKLVNQSKSKQFMNKKYYFVVHVYQNQLL